MKMRALGRYTKHSFAFGVSGASINWRDDAEHLLYRVFPYNLGNIHGYLQASV